MTKMSKTNNKNTEIVKPKCPTCNRILPRNIYKFSIIEFHRKIRDIVDIESLNKTKEYILRIIKYYYSPDVYLEFTNELDRQIESGENIDNIKNWIVTYLMNSSGTLEIRGLPQIHNSNLITILREYLIAKYIDSNSNLDESFSQFYDNFNIDNNFSKQSVSRALKALGIKTKPKKINDKICICVCITNEELKQCLETF